jgi:acyl-CoA thioesterase FadM
MRRETGIEGVLEATAEWVHITREGVPGRAPPALIAAFPMLPPTRPRVELPAWEELPPVVLPDLHVRPWWTEMDPMGHVNHPRYVDWAEEAVAVALAAAGHDPIGVVPVAERVRFRAAAVAGDEIVVHTTRVGRVGSAAVLHSRMRRGDETVCDAWLVRGHLAGPGVWP